MRGFSYSNACSKYGASVGRGSCHVSEPRRVRLERVPLNSGGYDPGGAYWGVGEALYVAYDDETQLFVRAPSRLDAARLLHDQYPQLSFRGFKP